MTRLARVERAAAGVSGVLIVAAALAALLGPEPWDVAGVVALAAGSTGAVMAGPVVLRAWLAGRRPAPAVGRAAAPPYPPYPPLPAVDAAGDTYADQPIYVPPPRPAVPPVDPVDRAAAEAAAILQPNSPALPPLPPCACDHCHQASGDQPAGLLPPITPWSLSLLWAEIGMHLDREGGRDA